MYRAFYPAAECSIEQGTEAVPGDGAYYVLQRGRVIGRYRSLKAAREAYAKLIGPPAPKVRRKVTLPELIAEDTNRMSNQQLFWEPEDFRRYERNRRGRPKH